MRIILFLLLTVNINLTAQNYSFSNLVKGTKPDTVFIAEPMTADLNIFTGIRKNNPVIGLSTLLRADFQEVGGMINVYNYYNDENACFLCHKKKYKVSLSGYYEFGVPLITYKDKPASSKLIAAARIDTHAKINFVTKIRLKKFRIKLILGMSSGFEIYYKLI